MVTPFSQISDWLSMVLQLAYLSMSCLGYVSLQSFIETGHSLVQSVSRIRLFETPCTAACQISLSITNSWNLLKLMSITSVMPSNHIILSCPLLLPPSIFPSIRVFSSELVLHIRWPRYWSFSFSISPFNEYSGLISFRIDLLDLLGAPLLCSLLSVYPPQFKSINASVLSFLSL